MIKNPLKDYYFVNGKAKDKEGNGYDWNLVVSKWKWLVPDFEQTLKKSLKVHSFIILSVVKL